MAAYEHGQSGVNLTGIFDNLHPPSVPGTLKQVPVFFRLIADEIDFGRQITVRVDFVDQDGQALSTKEREYTVPKRGFPQEVMNIVWDLTDIQIDQPGIYDVNVFVNDDLLGGHPIYVGPRFNT